MNYLGIAFCIFFAIIGIVYEKKKINALTIFSVLWAIILFLSSIRLYDLNATQDSTYGIIALGIFIFGIGYIFFRIFFSKKVLPQTTYEKDYNLRYKILYILSIIAILFYLKDLMLIIGDILDGKSLDYIRALAQDSNSILYTSRSALENFLRMIFVLPFIMALQPVVAIDMVSGKKNKILLILNIILLVLRSFTDGSRVMFIYFIIHFLLAFIFSGSSKHKNVIKKNKNKIIVVLVLIIGVVLVYITSVARSGENTLKNMYYYYSIEPYMFEQWKDEVDSRNATGLGTASINGYVYPAIYMVKNILGMENYPERWYNDVFLLINATDKEWQVINSQSIQANAYVSIFWFFYLDGKTLGVIVGCILYSMLIAYNYSKLNLAMNNKNLCVYLFLLQGVVFSYVRMQFANETYAIAYIYILLLMYKNSNYRKEKNEINR